MAALGCLAPLLLLALGALLGGSVAGQQGFYWGAGAGFVLGLAIPAVMLQALLAARKRR